MNQHIFNSLKSLLSTESATSSISDKMGKDKLAFFSYSPIEKKLLIDILTKKIGIGHFVNAEHHLKNLSKLVNRIHISTHHNFRKSTLLFSDKCIVIYTDVKITELIGTHESNDETYTTILKKIKTYEGLGLPHSINLYENGLEK